MDPNLKAAAAYLRRAAQSRRSEADDLRRQAAHVEDDKKQKLRQIKAEEQARRVGIYKTDGDMQRADQMRELNDLRNQELATEREAAQHVQQLQQDASNKESDMNDLIQKAGELEQKAS